MLEESLAEILSVLEQVLPFLKGRWISNKYVDFLI